MRPIHFLRSARIDPEAEHTYYAGIDPALGTRFLETVEQTVAAIRDHPLAMRVIEHNVHRWPLESFPHGLFYQAEEAHILILAVFHPRQDPKQWRARARP